MNSNKTLSDYLDIIIKQIAKSCTKVSKTGLMTGTTGIAILLYHYARYKNQPEITEYANHLITTFSTEIKLDAGLSLDNGLLGIAWGFDYLIKQGFVQAEDDIFEEIDAFLFEENSALYLFDLGIEAEKGLHVWNRLNSCESSQKNTWTKRIENCLLNFRDIVMQKYVMYQLPFFPCKTLIRFFHICQTFREHSLYRSEIDAVYKELPEIVKISFMEEKRLSDKYLLASMLTDIPMFNEHIPKNDITHLMTGADASNFYLSKLVLDRSISIPEAVNRRLLSIATDHQQINDILSRLNPDNLGLGNEAGGLAWALLQWSIENNPLKANKKADNEYR